MTLVNVSYGGFLIDQVMMNFPGLIVWLTGLIVFLFFKKENNYRVLALASVFVVLLLMLSHGKSYYTLGAYTLLLAMGGYVIEKYYKRWLRYIVTGIIVLLAIPVIPLSLPLLSLSETEKYTAPIADLTNRWEDGKIYPLPQDFADMTGWKELSDIVIKTYQSLPDEVKNDCNIFAENYGQAGAIFFYGKPYKLPLPISFSDNFLLWAPDSVSQNNLIYINDEPGDIKILFNNYKKVGEVNNRYFRENGVQVYFCTHPTDLFKDFYAQKVKELKKVYTRQ